MVIRGGKLKSVLNLLLSGYPNPKNRGCKTVPETKTAGPETRGYSPRTRPAAILKQGHCFGEDGKECSIGTSDTCEMYV
jgi:hypothetical protein